SNDPMADFDPSLNFKLNGALPSYLAFMAKRAGVRRYIYASSCSVYGYTVNELYDEDSPVSCNYPYGISKLQGERGVQQLADDDFSVISLRQGTVSGYSPRMRFDLIANAMFKSAMTTGTLTVNNPSIWRPILDIRDAVTAYLRAIQADFSLSGVYNVASDNYTVGQVGDMVQQGLQRLGHGKVNVDIKAIQDYRNYKVTFQRAKTYLGYAPQYTVEDTIEHVFQHRDEYGDYSNDEFYNIKVFEGLAAAKAW
ncbi:MAG: SDR family oxidoreductase, partial [Phycisphaerales bacterium]|nr:SDR family oxidoreductase [Phycisphaerales bacterium]